MVFKKDGDPDRQYFWVESEREFYDYQVQKG